VPKLCELCRKGKRACKKHVIPHEIYENAHLEGGLFADLGQRLSDLEAGIEINRKMGDVLGASFQRNAVALFRAFCEHGMDNAS
jgi:hypothetical protein